MVKKMRTVASDLKAEPVIMASAYGYATVNLHSWIANAVVTVGYFAVAVISARDEHRRHKIHSI